MHHRRDRKHAQFWIVPQRCINLMILVIVRATTLHLQKYIRDKYKDNYIYNLQVFFYLSFFYTFISSFVFLLINSHNFCISLTQFLKGALIFWEIDHVDASPFLLL